MATNPDQNAIDDAEFSAAFNEDQPGPREQTDEEAFSNMDESGSSETPADGDVVTVEGDGQPEGQADAGEGAMAEGPATEGEGATTDTASGEGEQAADPMVETAAVDAGAGEEEPTDPKELQRKKSWEGRLKAREEELRLREEAMAGKKDVTVGAETAPMSDTPGEAVAELAAAVDSGDMTPEQAMKTLEEDFGPEFVKMLSVLVGAKASEAVNSKVGEVSKTMDQLIGEIVDDKARAHFEEIADAHPDFAQINGSEELAAYMASLPDDQRAKAEKVATDGSARQINKLLDGFKAWAGSQGAADKSAGDQPAESAQAEGGMGMGMGGIDESAADAAEGVRSTGMALPNSPEREESYEAAWSKF